MNKSQISIEKRATALLLKFGLQDDPPVDVFDLARKIGLETSQQTLPDDVSGVLVVKNTEGKIGYNVNHPSVRQRFTVAHEIGHFVLKHVRSGSIFIDQPKKHMSFVKYRNSASSSGSDWQEIEANAFAAAVLMPEHLIEQKIQQFAFDLSDPIGEEKDDLAKLAREFQVSSQAMAIRLSTLGYLRFY